MVQKTVLIVDDTVENLIILTEILKPFYLVKAASKGSVALKIAATKPDLIILDVLMPEMDGYEIYKAIKSHEETKDIPVIFLSSNTDQDEIDIGMAMGAKHYLFKPIDPEKVLAAVESGIGETHDLSTNTK